MIHLTGAEKVRTERNGPLRRLADLDRWDTLCAANEAARAGQREMADALYAWQYRLLRRELAALGDGGNAA